jgi:hypothetical protein
LQGPSKEIGHIRFESQNQFEKFEEDKDRQKEINVEIGRRRQLAMMRASGSVANVVLILKALFLSLLPLLGNPFLMFIPLIKSSLKRRTFKVILHLPSSTLLVPMPLNQVKLRPP